MSYRRRFPDSEKEIIAARDAMKLRVISLRAELAGCENALFSLEKSVLYDVLQSKGIDAGDRISTPFTDGEQESIFEGFSKSLYEGEVEVMLRYFNKTGKPAKQPYSHGSWVVYHSTLVSKADHSGESESA